MLYPSRAMLWPGLLLPLLPASAFDCNAVSACQGVRKACDFIQGHATLVDRLRNAWDLQIRVGTRFDQDQLNFSNLDVFLIGFDPTREAQSNLVSLILPVAAVPEDEETECQSSVAFHTHDISACSSLAEPSGNICSTLTGVESDCSGFPEDSSDLLESVSSIMVANCVTIMREVPRDDWGLWSQVGSQLDVDLLSCRDCDRARRAAFSCQDPRRAKKSLLSPEKTAPLQHLLELILKFRCQKDGCPGTISLTMDAQGADTALLVSLQQPVLEAISDIELECQLGNFLYKDIQGTRNDCRVAEAFLKQRGFLRKRFRANNCNVQEYMLSMARAGRAGAGGAGQRKEWPLTLEAISQGGPCLDDTGCWCSKGQEGEDAWMSGVHPALCCLMPNDAPHAALLNLTSAQRCQHLLQHVRCCRPFFEANPVASQQLLMHSLLPAPPTDNMRIHLWLTTSHEYQHFFGPFLESVSFFWPHARWQSEVIVVLDEGVTQDEVWCEFFVKRSGNVRCALEPPPPPHPSAEFDMKGVTFSFSRGLTRNNWNKFFADKHTADADWIAITEPDTIFYSEHLPELLFDWSQPEPRPVMFGAVVPQFVPVVLLLKLPWVAEFMDSFPMIVRPRHLQGLRHYMMQQLGASTFEESFYTFIFLLEAWSAKRGWHHSSNSIFGFESLLGSYLYEFHREEYFWSIRDGTRTNLPLHHACPSLRASRHFGSGKCKYSGTLRNAERSKALNYKMHAYELMKAGHDGLRHYPPRTASEQFLTDELLQGDLGHWNTSDCHGRSLQDLFDSYIALGARSVQETVDS